MQPMHPDSCALDVVGGAEFNKTMLLKCLQSEGYCIPSVLLYREYFLHDNVESAQAACC